MECPRCGGKLRAYRTVQYEDRTYRRRKCEDCGKRVTTNERIEKVDENGDGDGNHQRE